jgi:hypothetical protein
MAVVQLEGLDQLKNLMTSGIEPATFRLVVPQPTMLPRAPFTYTLVHYLEFCFRKELRILAEGQSIARA